MKFLRARARIGRRKLRSAAGVTVTLGLLSMGVTSAPAAMASGPATKPVGFAPAIPKNASLLGRTQGSRALHFDVVLAPRDPAGLHSLALDVSTPGSPDHGRYLNAPQFAARFGQSPSAIQAADAALRGAKLAPGPVAANGLVIPVSTTVGQAAASLHTDFADYRLSSGRVAFANTSAPQLPTSLANLTTAVVGLNNFTTPVTAPPAAPKSQASSGAAAQAKGPSACLAADLWAFINGGWTFPQLASAYSIKSLYQQGHLGSGTRVALFELEPWSTSDVASFQKCYGTHVPVSSVKVDGGAGSGPGSGEAALDIETIIGLAPKADITVYDAPNSSDATTIDEYTKIFDDDKSQIVSTSWGACESAFESQDPNLIGSENILFEQAATEGISVFAASGDTGSEECLRSSGSKSLAAEDPASQPFVTGVGGTDLTSVGSPPAEHVWNEAASNEGAGGGGISSVWPMPAWQSGPGVINPDSSGTPCGAGSGYCREVPDVSASADPSHGYIIRWHGKWLPIGGTSAATPLWAATLADIESANSPVYRAGFLNPLLYSAAATSATSFNDITVGNNDYTGTNGGLYPATTGYDMASGLGSPIATGLASDIAATDSKIAFTDAPGTGSPPPYLGTHKVQQFNALSCTSGTTYAGVTGPTGNVSFNPGLECEQVGAGWQTWSNGYTGDVYWDNANQGGSTTMTLTLPKGTRAFYFYAEPDQFETFNLQATAQNGTTSGPLQVYGLAGAQYLGFYGNGPGTDIKTITISCDDDFAVGEMGIAK